MPSNQKICSIQYGSTMCLADVTRWLAMANMLRAPLYLETSALGHAMLSLFPVEAAPLIRHGVIVGEVVDMPCCSSQAGEILQAASAFYLIERRRFSGNVATHRTSRHTTLHRRIILDFLAAVNRFSAWTRFLRCPALNIRGFRVDVGWP